MFNRLFPSTFGRKKLAKFAKNIAQGKNVTQIFGNRWESSNMQATVNFMYGAKAMSFTAHPCYA